MEEYSTDNFPYKTYFTKSSDVMEKIKNIKNNIPSYSDKPYRFTAISNKLGLVNGKYYDKYIKIITPESAYEQVNTLTDYFNEKSRMNCSFDYYKEPVNYWKSNKKKILFDIQKSGKELTPYNIREYIYGHIKECNLFKVTTAIFVYNFLKATHILDFSAGWGDRLLSACGLNIKYFGIDPNINNHDGYNKIIEFAGKKDFQTVFQSGAEYLPKSVIEDRVKKYGLFDLIFTSPPYFDHEIYASSLQSISSYSNSSEYWLVYFLFVVLIKYIPYLSVDGTLCLYIQDIYNKMTACEPIILFLGTFYPNMEFSGIISENLPMLLFKKKSENIPKINEIMENKFKIAYPLVYELADKLVKRKLYDYYTIDTKITPYKINTNTITIIDDVVSNNIYFRSFFKYIIQLPGTNKFLSYGSKMGTMIYYLSKACFSLNKSCYYYCPKIEPNLDQTDGDLNFIPLKNSSLINSAIQKYNLKLIEIDVDMTKKQISYIKHIIRPKSDELVIPFAEFSNQLRNIMTETILETMMILGIDVNFSGTIFLSVSITILLGCLYTVFKKAKFFVVQLNNSDYSNYYEMSRTIVVNSEYKFSQNVTNEDIPPVDIKCVKNINCKVWKYFKMHAVEKDILWMSDI